MVHHQPLSFWIEPRRNQWLGWLENVFIYLVASCWDEHHLETQALLSESVLHLAEEDLTRFASIELLLFFFVLVATSITRSFGFVLRLKIQSSCALILSELLTVSHRPRKSCCKGSLMETFQHARSANNGVPASFSRADAAKSGAKQSQIVKPLQDYRQKLRDYTGLKLKQ